MLIEILINSSIIAIVVVIHYEVLLLLSSGISKLTLKHRTHIVLGVFGVLIAHTIEVWIFASAYYFMNKTENLGHLEGRFDGSLLDCVYYSFTAYTTLGLGDIVPAGAIRFLSGIEALTGLVLITWSASFLFIKLQRSWPSE